MHPAFSVIFLTTLIGAAQGLFLALFSAEAYAAVGLLPEVGGSFFVAGGLVALGLLAAGLAASFFHLGHPERAWRTAAKWRTSWLSREVIVLPALIGIVLLYTAAHALGWDLPPALLQTSLVPSMTLLLGAIGVIVVFALFVSTAMIYACIKFLAEWATPLTVINYTLLGSASGFTLATALAGGGLAPALVPFFVFWAVVLTLAALVTRVMSLVRNARLKPVSTTQTAIGVRHSKIRQRAQGASAGSFNTREFFHGASARLFGSIRWTFLVLVFPLPVVLLLVGAGSGWQFALPMAFLVQYVGLIAERWFFFAQANHPQNLYYQYVS